MSDAFKKDMVMDRAQMILTQREHSRLELERKLKDRGYAMDDIERVLARFVELKYIDDARYARAVIRDRMLIRRRGRMDVIARLAQAGVDRETVDRAFSDMEEEIDERHLCMEAAESRLGRIRDDDARKRWEKLARHLHGRGFPPDMIRSVLAELEDTRREEEE